jgi:hypothetical protein
MSNRPARRHLLPLLVLISFLICVLPATAYPANFTPVIDPVGDNDITHYNITSHMDDGKTTPVEVWAIAAILGLILFLYSLPPKGTTPELEHSIIVSVIAWIPIGFTAYTSFAVDRITSFGVTSQIESQAANGAINTHEFVLMENHVIYHFDVIGIIYIVFLAGAIINTVRLISLHKALRLQSESEKQI